MAHDISGSTGHSLRGRCGINPIDRYGRSCAAAVGALATRGKTTLPAKNRLEPGRKEIIPLYRLRLVPGGGRPSGGSTLRGGDRRFAPSRLVVRSQRMVPIRCVNRTTSILIW